MIVKTNIKTGDLGHNHNEKLVSDKKEIKIPFFARKLEGKRLIVRSGIKAGAMEQDCKKTS